MRYRFTNQELKELTNQKLLISLIRERQSDCTNIFAPFYRRLLELEKWVTENIKE